MTELAIRPPETALDPVEAAIEAVARGEIVVVLDDDDRENEGDFVMAAEHATPEAVNFMVTHGRGLVCLPMAGELVDRLDLPAMVPGAGGCAFTVSIDLAEPANTGISAADRARCIRRAIDPAARPADFSRPGHVFPLRAQAGGVLQRAGHTEAAVDLARLAGLAPAGVICEIINADGQMARRADLVRLAARHGLVFVTVADVVAHRRRHERLVQRVAEATVMTAFGPFTVLAYRTEYGDGEQLAFVKGDLDGKIAVLVRTHAECIAGDVFGSAACDCRSDLEDALRDVAGAGAGVVVYTRGDHSHGLGLGGHPAPVTGAFVTAQILADLGVEPAPEVVPATDPAPDLYAAR